MNSEMDFQRGLLQGLSATLSHLLSEQSWSFFSPSSEQAGQNKQNDMLCNTTLLCDFLSAC